jgi:hypothetical protein
MPYAYTLRLAATAQTAAKTLLQIKAGNAACQLVSAHFSQVTKTTSEILSIQILRKSAAATVTSATPAPLESTAPAALAVGSTSGTGTNASGEGTDGAILHEENWNVLNGVWQYLPVPEERIWIPVGGILGIKLNTAPAASMTITALCKFIEFQG